jgi:putative transposase
MPRRARNAADDVVYHVLNRGNCRMEIFRKPEDFAAFVRLIELARRRFPSVRVLGYCLMDNHWHLVLWPRRGTDLSRFMGWLCTTHVRRWREHRGNAGQGHLYQGRYKSFPIQQDEHLLTVLRYVESNPLRAGKVKRAQDWDWSSLTRRAGIDNTRIELSDWPVDRPRGWQALTNAAIDPKALEQVRGSVTRGRPLGGDAWTRRAAARWGLESTMRDPWRPKKQPSTKMTKG